MDANLAGFVAPGVPIPGLFAWLRQGNRALRGEMNGRIDSLRGEIAGLRDELGELRERVARIEGLLEAVFMRRDLTPLPDPPAPGPRGEPAAA